MLLSWLICWICSINRAWDTCSGRGKRRTATPTFAQRASSPRSYARSSSFSPTRTTASVGVTPRWVNAAQSAAVFSFNAAATGPPFSS